jgi:hypothetical protein
MADPRPEYLALARRYQDFAMGATDGQFDWPAACKVASKICQRPSSIGSLKVNRSNIGFLHHL